MAKQSQLADFVFWVIDTRSIWEGDKIGTAAAHDLRLLSIEEQAKAGKFYFLRDAKLSVASSILKRLYVAKTLGIPWREISFTRRGDLVHGKPCYKSSAGEKPRIDFNVSHQAGLAALVGCRLPGVEVGIDITCVNEREKHDLQMITEEGFEHWVDMHEDVFSAADLKSMKSPIDESSSPVELPARLRRFYAYWCLKEAYVKLAGEGLLAKWLKDVEFRNVRCPEPGEDWGQRVSGIEVWIKGQRQHDVTLMLQAFEGNYIFGTAHRQPQPAPAVDTTFAMIDLKKDAYPFAE